MSSQLLCYAGLLKIVDFFRFQAMERAQGNQWNYAHLCLINTGGIRVDIDPGSKYFD